MQLYLTPSCNLCVNEGKAQFLGMYIAWRKNVEEGTLHAPIVSSTRAEYLLTNLLHCTSSVGMGLASIRFLVMHFVGRMDARPIPTDEFKAAQYSALFQPV
jgi:hypothetical protein